MLRRIFIRARDKDPIVVMSNGSIQSFFLKFIEYYQDFENKKEILPVFSEILKCRFKLEFLEK